MGSTKRGPLANTQTARVAPRALAVLAGLLAAIGAWMPAEARGSDEAGASAALMRLLESDQLPPERVGTVVEMIGRRGNSADLARVYRRALPPDGLPAEARLRALESLADAAANRRVVPAGPLSELTELLDAEDDALRRVAVRLAGLWKVEPAAERLRALARDPDLDPALRQSSVAALVEIGGQPAREAIEELTRPGQPLVLRSLGAAALARLDAEAAATLAAEMLGDAGQHDDLAPLLRGFLNLQGGSRRLADALRTRPLDEDAAKLALRAVYALGHSDPELTGVLSDQAGVSLDAEPLTPAELEALVAEVEASGDAGRGELIFRREELSCLKCHAVSKAGGDVGPDLSAIGSSSPVDYIIRSILEPDESIKEQYQTLVVLTADGDILQGIAVDRDQQRLVLKDATGSTISVPVSEIDDEFAGGSLMPRGLTSFLTRQEFVDLVSFLAQLGRPGPYEIRSTPSIQRWRVLQRPSDQLRQFPLDAETFEREVLSAADGAWTSAYARVAGDLPLDELAGVVELQQPLILEGQLEVTQGGGVRLLVEAPAASQVWVNQQLWAAPADASSGRLSEEGVVELERGRQRVIVCVEPSAVAGGSVWVEVVPAGSPAAQFTVVGGP